MLHPRTMTTGLDAPAALRAITPPLAAGGTPSPTLGAFVIVRRLAHDYVRGQWGILAAAVICMLITAGMNVSLAYIMDPAIKLIFLDKRADMLAVIPLLACAILFARAGSYYGQQTLIESLGERVVVACQRDMFDNLIRRDLASLNAVHSGQFVSNFLYDATLLREAITKGVAGIALEAVSLIGFAGLMIYQDWKLAFFSVVVMPAIAWVMNRIGRSLRRATTRGMEETGGLSTALSEALDGRRIIKAYGLESHISELAQKRLSSRLKFQLKVVRARAAAVPSTDIFAGLVIAATIYYAGYQVMHGQLEFNRFISFIAAMLLAQQPVRNLSQLWSVALPGIAAANRVFAVIDARPRIIDRPGATSLSVAPAPKGGSIRFADVSFTYREDENSPAIDRVTSAMLRLTEASVTSRKSWPSISMRPESTS